MATFVDETANREKRDLDLMRELLREKERSYDEREKRQSEMVLRREKEIRDDMRQLAASEARVAALQQQLQDQSMLPPNVRGELMSQGRPYSVDYPPWSKPAPWFTSPGIGNEYDTPMPMGAINPSSRNTGLPGKNFPSAFTPVGDITNNCNIHGIVPRTSNVHAAVELSACSAVSADTTTVSVLQARPSVSTSDGPQQSVVGGYSVILPFTMATDASLPTNMSTMNCPGSGQVHETTVPAGQSALSVTGVTAPLSTLSLSSVSQGMVPATVIVPP